MPRIIPACPTPPTISQPRRDYTIRVVTPLFGGGVEAGVNDPLTPIRATSIRGQLQFWWRATRGAAIPREELFRRHGDIWGRTEKASPVQVEVRNETHSAPQACARYEGESQRVTWIGPFQQHEHLRYAAFPFQGSNRRESPEPPASFIPSASFTLRLRYPVELGPDVETAVWAWVNFGGLGARTRRGCGSLRCDELAPKDFAGLKGWLATHAGGLPLADREWPTLGSTLLVRDEAGPVLLVWNWIVGLLREFRQGEGFARNPGRQPNRPGRSRYPEPETIRQATRRREAQHPRLPQVPDDAFPRAELGLPIVFHFQGQGTPPDTQLYPDPGRDGKSRDRMASPIIVKPLVLADGRAVPLLLRLKAPPLTGVDLRQGRASVPLPPVVVRGARLASYQNSPLSASASGSAIEALLAFARQSGMGEVTR